MDGLALATQILTRAVTLDANRRLTEALVTYQEGINILLEHLKRISDDNPSKEKIRNKTKGT